MDIKSAIITRIDELTKDTGKKIGKICLDGGLTPSVYYDFVNGRTKLPRVDTVKRICQGAGVTMSEFFDREYFDHYEE